MDLVSIARAIWRHKLAAVLVIILTALASLYVVKIKPAVYQVSSSILLANPPPSATKSQIAANPALRNASSYNTFTSYGTLSVIAQAVIDSLTSVPSQSALVKLGIDPAYQVALTAATNEPTGPPIIDITSFGETPQQAIRGANLLISATKSELYQLQKSDGVDNFYMVKAIDIVKPAQAKESSSRKLRSLVAVLGGGLILLLVVLSLTDALDKRKRGSRAGTGTRHGRTPFRDSDQHVVGAWSAPTHERIEFP